MTYLVVVDTTPDNKIAKMQEYGTRAEADAHVTRVLPNYPNAFVVDNPPSYVVEYTTVDVVAKTITYDSAGYDSDKTMKDWKASMQETDSSMPRTMEDILDGMPNKLSVAKITLDRLQTKKDLRATKP
jgi:hypothetical protein